MRILADISIGDWVDRLTILEIKLVEIGERDKLDNIRREYETLLAAAPDGLLADADVAELRERLKAVNRELWVIEDEIRIKERVRAFDEDFIALARRVYVTNDRRAEIKREINRIAHSDLVEEKSYAKYG